MARAGGYARVLSKVSRIRKPQDRRTALTLAVTLGFILACVILLVSQEVRPYGWSYSESFEDGWMNPGHDVSTWTPVELPSLMFDRKYSTYYRGTVELSGVVKPDVVVAAQKKIAAVYVNGNEVKDYGRTETTSAVKFGEAIVLRSNLFKPGKNVLAVQVNEGAQRILHVRSLKTNPSDSKILLLFYLTPAVMFLILNRKRLDSNKVALIVFLALALVFLKPIFHDFTYWGGGDWDLVEGFNAVARETLLRYRQIPLWNPYMAGGTPMLADPQSMVLSPFFPVILLCNVISGFKINLVLWYLTGLAGMYLLGKHLKLGVYARYAMAFTFMFSSLYSLHIMEGHVQPVPTPLLPWVFLFYLKALEDKKYAIPGAMAMAFMLFAGGVYTLIYTAMFLIVYAVFASLQNFFDKKQAKRALNPLATLIVIGVLCSALSAVKALPMLELSLKYPRLTPQNCSCESTYLECIDTYRGYDLKSLFYAFLGSTQGGYSPDVRSSIWYEFGVYIGPVAAVLALGGMVFYWKRKWPLLLVAAFGVLLAFGTCQPHMILWNLLHRLPILSSMRYPSRFIILAFFPLTIFVGYMMSRIEQKKAFIACVLALMVFYNLVIVDSPALNDISTTAPRAITETSFLQTMDTPERILVYTETYKHFLQNQGTVNSGSLSVMAGAKTAAKPIGDVNYNGEFYLHNGNGKASVTSFSPNRLVVDVEVEYPDTLVVNQNYETGWKTTTGEAVYSKNGLMAVDLAPSQREVVLYYSPASFKAGLAVTLIALLAAFKYLRLSGRRNLRNYVKSLWSRSFIFWVLLILLFSQYGVEFMQSGVL